MKQKPFYSLTRLLKASSYSIEGLIATFKTEAAFRLEVFLSAILIPIIITTDHTLTEKLLLLFSLFLVLIVEVINSSIEAIVDRVSIEEHALSKKAKDAGSAAVMISVVNCVIVWSLVLFS